MSCFDRDGGGQWVAAEGGLKLELLSSDFGRKSLKSLERRRGLWSTALGAARRGFRLGTIRVFSLAGKLLAYVVLQCLMDQRFFSDAKVVATNF